MITVTVVSTSSRNTLQECIWKSRRPPKSALFLTASKKCVIKKESRRSTHTYPCSISRGPQLLWTSEPLEIGRSAPHPALGESGGHWEKEWVYGQLRSRARWNHHRKTKSHREWENTETGSEVWEIKALALGKLERLWEVWMSVCYNLSRTHF